MINYFYKEYLKQYPCIHQIRSTMSKPRTHYMPPEIKRQLCGDVFFVDTHLGQTPKLAVIDTIDEYGTVHDLPLKYNSEDIKNAFLDRLRADTFQDIQSASIVADPESTIGKAKHLFKQLNEYAHLHTEKVPTATHVALVENLIKKLRSKLIATESQFETAYSVKMPLYFKSAVLNNVMTKINHISNQGTLSATAPAILRGEEPLDYKALISLKAGDIVLAYKREQDTNAVFVIVLDHTFGKHPVITAGFNLETQQNISAGKGNYAKWKRVTTFPKHIAETLKSIRAKSVDEFNKCKRRQTKATKKLEIKLMSSNLNEEQRLEIQNQLQQAPPNEVPAILEPVIAPVAPTQGGESTDTSQVPILKVPILDPNTSSVSNATEPATIPEVAPAVEVPTIEPKASEEAPKQAAEPKRELRPKARVDYKKLSTYKALHTDLEVVQRLKGKLFVQEHNTRGKNNRRNKSEQESLMKDFLIFHTTITAAAKEDKELVHEAVSLEYDQLLKAPKGQKKVLKLMKKTFNIKGKQVIPSLIFMKKKMNKATKQFEKWKARLVAGGHRQDAEMYAKNDISVPTLDHASLLLFLAVMMKRKDCKFYQMDFPGAYLKADLESEIYMSINKQNVDILRHSHPEIIPDIRDDGTIIARIQKALYGLKESGKLFRDKVVELFKEFGLEQLENHQCIFQKKLSSGKYIYCCVYVDDVIIATNEPEAAAQLKDHCDVEFPGIELISSEKFSFLGMSITFDYKNFTIRYNTSLYIEELCAKYGVTEGSEMPYTSGFLKNDLEAKPMENVTKYKSLVMALFYVAKKTRPDILFPVAYLATEASNPTHEHMAKALMVLSYLFETKDMEMTHCCNGEDPRRLLAFVDASYAIHKDMKGHTGALIFDELLNLFFSSSSKHKMMGKSSTDAEIIGAHATMNTIELLKALHQELTGSNEPAILFQDNLSAKFLMENGDSASDKSKHMKIRYFYIKEKVDEKVVEIQYRKTERMWADLLTKPISNKRVFKLMRSKMMNFQPGDVYYISE